MSSCHRTAGHRAPRALVALTALVVLGSGCSSDGGEASPPESAPSSGATRTQPPGEPSAAPSEPGTDTDDQAGEGEGGAPPTLPDEAQGELLGQFVNFALRPSSDTVGTVTFAAQVDLGVGTEVVRTLPPSDLGNPRRWRLPADGGRVSALDTVTAQAQQAVENQQDTGIFAVTAGEHDRCTAPPAEPLPGYSVDQQVSVMPGARSISSCQEWFAVDLYVDDDGAITAVRLDPYAS